MKDYYKILEIRPSASCEEIKRSYRRLALKYHPDKNSGSMECHRLFTEINQAYKTLSHEDLRKRYDMTYKMKIAREIRPVTPQMFLEKFQNIRQFIYTKGKNKISQSALSKGLGNLLSDNNLSYLSSKNNISVNEHIIEEVLKCCNFLSETEMKKITARLKILAGSENKFIQSIEDYEEHHKTIKNNIFVEMLANLSHKVTTIFK